MIETFEDLKRKYPNEWPAMRVTNSDDWSKRTEQTTCICRALTLARKELAKELLYGSRRAPRLTFRH